MTDAYLDISDCCSHHANEAIDDLFLKAVSDPPDDEIWQKHQSVYIRRIIEMFTARGLQRLSSFHTEAAKWLDANRKANGRPTDRPASGMRWWSPGEMFLVGEYLQAIPSSDLTVDDWMMLGDYLAQKYMAVDDLEAEASWLAYRSTLMGRVQYDAPDLTEGQSDMVLSALPMTQAEASKQFDLPSYLNQLMDFGRVRCAEMVVALADKARHDIKKTIIEYQFAEKTLDTPMGEALQTRLHDQFSTLNRDWRRIAVTEAGENADQSFVASTPDGGQLRRLEQYANACPWCRKIDGRVVTVVPPSKPKKDGDTEIWVGKTNYGRSASPMKRGPGGLTPRSPDEMWWIAAGTQHPHCRGTWATVDQPKSAGDSEFTKWLWKTLEESSP
jgi:hypothetical protein